MCTQCVCVCVLPQVKEGAGAAERRGLGACARGPQFRDTLSTICEYPTLLGP